MSDNYHDPWANGLTGYTEADMNAPLGQLDQALTDLATTIYDIGGSFEAVPGSLQVLLRYPVPRAISFSIDLGLSRMVAEIPATATSIFSIQRNNTEFGTASFLATASAAVVAGEATVFAAGDILTIVSPASPDATLENIGWALVAARTVLEPID